MKLTPPSGTSRQQTSGKQLGDHVGALHAPSALPQLSLGHPPATKRTAIVLLIRFVVPHSTMRRPGPENTGNAGVDSENLQISGNIFRRRLYSL